jgi:hypothetical protein
MARVLSSDKLCVYQEETILCVWAVWCGGIWAELAKSLGCFCLDMLAKKPCAEVRSCAWHGCLYVCCILCVWGFVFVRCFWSHVAGDVAVAYKSISLLAANLVLLQ